MFENRLCESCLNKESTYYYMPSYGAYCDNCVPVGCSCNYRPFDMMEGELGKDYIYVGDGLYTYIDKNGNEYPCCEFHYEEEPEQLNTLDEDSLKYILESLEKVNIKNKETEYYNYIKKLWLVEIKKGGN